MKTLTQKHFKYLPKQFKWITVDKNGEAWAHNHQPRYCKSKGMWVPQADDAEHLMDWVGDGYTFGQVAERKPGWFSRVVIGWLVETPEFCDADRYRFARDVLFNTELWNLYSAHRFAERYDWDAARYDACIDKAMAEAIEKGIWK